VTKKYVPTKKELTYMVKFFERHLSSEVNRLENDIINRIVRDEQDPDHVVKVFASRFDLPLYFKMTGRNLTAELEAAKNKAVSKKKALDVPLSTKESVCHAWFDLYVPDGAQPQSWFGKVTSIASRMFKDLSFGCYNPETNQGAVQLHIASDRGTPEEIVSDLEFVVKYIRPNKDGKRHVHVITPDCSYSGSLYLAFTTDGVVQVEFTHGSRTDVQFTGVLEDAVKFILDRHCHDTSNDRDY
jgi:hypothetical protein